MGSEYADTDTGKEGDNAEIDANGEPRNLTLVSDITCNDGNLSLQIKGTQLKKERGLNRGDLA